MRLDLSVLNSEQLEAVTAGEGPLLVLAGAGTGKTRVITYRIANLIRQGTAGDSILGITFTNKAAREMRDRLLRMYPDLDPRPTLCTFHALGLRILRAEHERIGYRKKFPIYDESDVQEVLIECLRDLAGVDAAETGYEEVRRVVSQWKSRFRSPEDAQELADDDRTFLCARAYARYRDRMEGLNAVDFDDLIYMPVRLLEDNADARDTWQEQFRYVLIDEYQDTNTAQYRFARVLAGDRENLCVVGDDDQSIYAFRGAEVEKILSFKRDFVRAQVVTLEENYRSVGTILDAANAVIANNPHRHPKQLRAARGPGRPIQLLELEDEMAEAEEVVHRIIEARRAGVPYDQQAILLRSAIQARAFEEKLRFHDIAYTIIGGRSFFDRKEVKDLVAYLRLLVSPEDDIAALRILNVPRRSWGKGSREKLDAWARENKVSIVEALRRVDEIPGLAAPARQGAQDLLAVLDQAAEAAPGSAILAARCLVDRLPYDQALREMSSDSHDVEFRQRNINSFLESLERYERKAGPGKLGEFLHAMTLQRTDEEEDEPEGLLTLLTFHGAKGLEFPHVHLVGIEDHLIPHRRAEKEGGDAAVEEERRLFYVAITRAKDVLTFTRARQRRRYGKDFETEESRFLAEIPEHLIERKLVSKEDESAADEDVARDFLAEMRAKFQS